MNVKRIEFHKMVYTYVIHGLRIHSKFKSKIYDYFTDKLEGKYRNLNTSESKFKKYFKELNVNKKIVTYYLVQPLKMKINFKM